MTGLARAAEAVVFDMDGVLIDSGAHHRAAWRALLDELGVEPAPDFWRLTIGRPAEEAVPLVLGADVSPDQAWRLAYRKRQHYVRFASRGMQPVPGVTAFVERLARAGVPCAVATSASSTDVYDLLAEIGVATRFGAIVTADDVRFGKPHPEVYVRAARAIAKDPARCVAFEDSVVGVQAARAAGMTVIGVTTAYLEDELRQAGAAATIPSFEGLGWPL
ncbi:MAG: HAD family phosphatase [Candidatus Rokubacteria bacterium]|nr:HAD family phosphatase [Candidatus Rokubacteria bacterium]